MKFRVGTSLVKHMARVAACGLIVVLGALTLSSSSYPLAAAGDPLPAASIETIQFHSTLIGKTLPYKVVLPADYRVARATRYPVLYLLHGLSGHYSDWTTRTNVADYASKYRLI